LEMSSNNVANLYLGDTINLNTLELHAINNPNGQTGFVIHVGSPARVVIAAAIPSSPTWELPPNTTFSPL